ncbi:MAG: FGGY-family carbohydrate kinase, partial [Clostridiales bacterium]|nr:FGGY-family carbohydrate kinase [Clostridiales bacterium]
MGDRTYILAHDLGTSGDKATLFDARGRMVASAKYAYATDYPRPGWVEQSPADWWKAVCVTTRELLGGGGGADVGVDGGGAVAADTGADAGARAGLVAPGEIACVVLSGHMMGCVLVDGAGAPLRPAIIWADTRAVRQEQDMLGRIGAEAGYRITGHRLSASYTAAKLLWVRDNEPAAYERAACVLNAKDYILHRLTGSFVTDYSDASGTNLLDLSALRWSDTILEALGIKASLLPELHASTDVVGGVTRAVAGACGLLAGTPVVAGGGDGSCACVGAGAVREGDVYGILGSSSWISSVARKPLTDPEMRTFNWAHLDPQFYTPCGTMQAAGLSAQWFSDALCDGAPVERLDESAAVSPVGANGLIFLPYILGERSPRWDVNARGAFAGISATTSRADMARAVLEGVGMNLRLIIGCLGLAPDAAITMIGGGAESRLWMQALADIWRRRVRLPERLSEAT